MRKILFLVTLALTCVLGAKAQYTQLVFTPTIYSLDSLQRLVADSVLTDENYYQTLKQIEDNLKSDKAHLSVLKKKLKGEYDRHKQQVKLLNERLKTLKQQSKAYKQEAQSYKNEKKQIEKQRKAIVKDKDLDTRLQQDQLRELDQRVQRIAAAEKDLTRKKMDLDREYERLKNDQISLADIKYSLDSKNNELKTYILHNKMDLQQIKNELKIQKAKMKAQK